eukprot:5524844-Ditylum_brightwellii.AAC.1
MWDAETEDGSVWGAKIVILDQALVAMVEELENKTARYIGNIIIDCFLPQIKQVTVVAWAV